MKLVLLIQVILKFIKSTQTTSFFKTTILQRNKYFQFISEIDLGVKKIFLAPICKQSLNLQISS